MSRESEIAALLAGLPLFSDMRAHELGRLAAASQLRRVERGATLFRFGDPCNEFHVVIDGQVKLYALAPNGQEKIIELIGPGQSFAEALMFTGRPYIVNAQALLDSVVLTVKKHAVLEEIERDSAFALRMLAGLSRKLHGLVHDVQSYSLRSGLQRVIGYLLRETDPDAPDDGAPQTVRLPASKAAIASRLSLTPEYFSRVLHELADQRLIEIDRREIRILDLERLAEYQLQ